MPTTDPLAYLDKPGALVSLAERVASVTIRPDGVSHDDAIQDAALIILSWRQKVHTHSPNNFRTPELFYRRVRLDLKKQYDRASVKNNKRRAAEQTRRVASDMVVFSNGQDRLNEDPTPVLQQQLDVREAVASLPPRLRAVVEAFYFEGKTQTEIALQIGSVQPAVSQMLKRAKAILRGRLGEEYMDE